MSPLAHLALIVIAMTKLRSSRGARLFVAAHVAGAVALARQGSSPDESAQAQSPTRLPVTALSQGLFLQGVALGGIVRFLRGDRATKWRTVER